MAREASCRRRSINVGFEPNGLTVADLNGNGNADLLVSNPLGDVQVLIGNGDGTFQPVQNLDQQVVAGGLRPQRKHAGRVHLRRSAHRSARRQDRRRRHDRPGRCVHRADHPRVRSTLADLNNNGILDLIVANSGSNNVLVYPGLGNGTFGPALNGGHGFFTGTDPVGITVADLNGDGRPDLIIANKGSNDVSILINVEGGQQLHLRAGATAPGRRRAGRDGGRGRPRQTACPTSWSPTAARTTSGCSRARQRLLQRPVSHDLSRGHRPDRGLRRAIHEWPGQDLVTVNSGSNSVTLISGLGSASPLMQTISSGGIDPTAAFAVDLSGNGLDSLVVANNGDGNISLFLSGENGLALSSVLSSPAFPIHPGWRWPASVATAWSFTRRPKARNPPSPLVFSSKKPRHSLRNRRRPGPRPNSSP